MLQWRLKAYRRWMSQGNQEPGWAKVSFDPIDYSDIYYYAAPASQRQGPTSIEDVDPRGPGGLQQAGYTPPGAG